MSALLPILGTVLVFMIIGAFFVAAETALITLRDSQVQRLSETHGRRGQRLEKLVKNPNRFLAAGQVGVTFAGFLSAAYGEKRIAPIIVPRLESLGLAQGTADCAPCVGAADVVTARESCGEIRPPPLLPLVAAPAGPRRRPWLPC